MAEYIERDKFRNILEAKAEMALGTPEQVFYNTIAMLDLIPAADVVEVVRCKDCRYSKPYLHYFYCENSNAPWAENTMANIMDANDFCSYGERKCDNDQH
ncbi:MAG: hypothetical protein IIW48_10145 [Clostridia bacterium]|nr:hypothetical protein [Clostridia bacterium]